MRIPSSRDANNTDESHLCLSWLPRLCLYHSSLQQLLKLALGIGLSLTNKHKTSFHVTGLMYHSAAHLNIMLLHRLTMKTLVPSVLQKYPNPNSWKSKEVVKFFGTVRDRCLIRNFHQTNALATPTEQPQPTSHLSFVIAKV